MGVRAGTGGWCRRDSLRPFWGLGLRSGGRPRRPTAVSALGGASASCMPNAAPRRYNLRIVTDIAIVGPENLVTAGA